MIRIAALILIAAFGLLPAFGQQHEAAPPADPNTAGDPNVISEELLAHESKQAEGQEEDAHAQFKQSPAVRFLGRILGIGPKAAYWMALVLNFLIVVGAIWLLARKALPATFRARTQAIRQQIEEARVASQEANRRLSDIEGRLARLDSEIHAMRTEAEREAASEEQRMHASAEADRRKILVNAEQEIAAAAKLARRELKAFAAELAVNLAERRLHIDPQTDQALVNEFVRQLGENQKERA